MKTKKLSKSIPNLNEEQRLNLSKGHQQSIVKEGKKKKKLKKAIKHQNHNINIFTIFFLLFLSLETI